MLIKFTSSAEGFVTVAALELHVASLKKEKEKN
jgi:hypothetical protein